MGHRFARSGDRFGFASAAGAGFPQLLGVYETQYERVAVLKVLCLIEEVDLNRRGAYDRIKNLVTAADVPIRKMRTDTYLVPNTSHFVQSANSAYNIPVDRDDTRIVFGEVGELTEPMDEGTLHERLAAEAPFMLHKLLEMDIPGPFDSRLWLPVLNTPVKEQVIAGTFNAEPSESELSVDNFGRRCLRPGGFAPRVLVWDSYMEFMSLEENADVAPVHRNALLGLLKERCHLDISTKKKRIDGRSEHVYEGIQIAS